MDHNLLYNIDTRGYADDLEPHNPRYVDAPKTLIVQSRSPTSATTPTLSSLTTSMATTFSSTSSFSQAFSTPSAPEAPLLNNNSIAILLNIAASLVLIVAGLVLGWAVFGWWHVRSTRRLRTEIEALRSQVGDLTEGSDAGSTAGEVADEVTDEVADEAADEVADEVAREVAGEVRGLLLLWELDDGA
ncbi:hypothetical protein BKA63DRAFT_98215 [Paraphoma chrysanthemicola]|nr:hypothetical protein BKA63DRAFT_98215 [Paraphoma chrysanthemicola]